MILQFPSSCCNFQTTLFTISNPENFKSSKAHVDNVIFVRRCMAVRVGGMRATLGERRDDVWRARVILCEGEKRVHTEGQLLDIATV